MSNIITPTNGLVSPEGPDVTLTITLDTKTMQTALRANKVINRLVVASVLQQHSLMLVQQVMAEAAIKEENKKHDLPYTKPVVKQ